MKLNDVEWNWPEKIDTGRLDSMALTRAADGIIAEIEKCLEQDQHNLYGFMVPGLRAALRIIAKCDLGSDPQTKGEER